MADIKVNDFKYIPGVNDREYVKLLENALERQREITGKAVAKIKKLSSAQPEHEEFEWCHDCKEYDHTAHCCHRWTKVIRQTVAEIQAEPVRHGKWYELATYDGCEVDLRCSNCGATVSGFVQDYKFCPYCGARMDETQKNPCDDCQQFDCYGCEYAERKDE